MIENRQPKFFYGYVVILATFSIMVMLGGIWVIFGVFFKPMLTEFGWTRAANVDRVWLDTGSALGGCQSAGIHSDPFGHRRRKANR